jgi:hypothetical protein
MLCLVVALLTSAAPAHAGHARPRSSVADALTAFVQGTLTLHVLALEGLIATTDWHLTPYCGGHAGHGSGQCSYPAATNWSEGLATSLDQQAELLAGVGQALAALPLPQLDQRSALATARLIEDLILLSGQVAVLLQDTATNVALGVPLEVALGFGYWPSLRRALALLARAEGWLEAADRQTGTNVRLPGFGPGQSLARQLNIR